MPEDTACPRCGKSWLNGTCESTPARRGLCDRTARIAALDRLYLDLKGARERLCRAQVNLPAHWRSDLDSAVAIIDNVGSSLCPGQWSTFDQPEVCDA